MPLLFSRTPAMAITNEKEIGNHRTCRLKGAGPFSDKGNLTGHFRINRNRVQGLLDNQRMGLRKNTGRDPQNILSGDNLSD